VVGSDGTKTAFFMYYLNKKSEWCGLRGCLCLSISMETLNLRSPEMQSENARVGLFLE
jgi:hypothetical protein